MRVLFLSSGVIDPATRFRAAQFFPHFEAAGVHCEHRGAYGRRYNAFFGTPLGIPYRLACRAKRSIMTLGVRGYDAVLLQRCAFDTTSLPERIAASLNPRIIFDVDDAVFLGPDGMPDSRREAAFRQAVALSARVIAGNRYLAEHAAAGAKTTIIPTVIDTDMFRPLADTAAPAAVDRIVIGWMGTAGHFKYFDIMTPAIRAILAENSNVVFRMVSNGIYRELVDHPQVEQVAWTEATELTELQSFDIGVMPLADSAWTRGKCGFKLIQYMSVGRPVVASPVGANVDIVAGSGGGFLVEADGWVGALRRLIMDAELRRDMGASGRRRIESSYSVQSVLGCYLKLFDAVARGGVA